MTFKRSFSLPEIPHGWKWDGESETFYDSIYEPMEGVGSPDSYDYLWIMIVEIRDESLRIPIMQYLRTIQPNMGLMDSKYLVNKVLAGEPICIAENVSISQAYKIWNDLALLGVQIAIAGGFGR